MMAVAATAAAAAAAGAGPATFPFLLLLVRRAHQVSWCSVVFSSLVCCSLTHPCPGRNDILPEPCPKHDDVHVPEHGVARRMLESLASIFNLASLGLEVSALL